MPHRTLRRIPRAVLPLLAACSLIALPGCNFDQKIEVELPQRTDTVLLTEQALYLLPDGRFDGAQGPMDLAAAMRTLGPPKSTKVVIKTCARQDVLYSQVTRAMAGLRDAGYAKVGVAPQYSDDCRR